jgi:hypothetical protein
MRNCFIQQIQTVQRYLSFTPITVHHCTRSRISSFLATNLDAQTITVLHSKYYRWRKSSSHILFLLTVTNFPLPFTCHFQLRTNFGTNCKLSWTLMNTHSYWTGWTAFSLSYKHLTCERMQCAVSCCVWRRGGHVTLHSCAIQFTAWPSNAQCEAKREKGSGGKPRLGNAPLLLRNRVPRFLQFNSSRMGRLCHNMKKAKQIAMSLWHFLLLPSHILLGLPWSLHVRFSHQNFVWISHIYVPCNIPLVPISSFFLHLLTLNMQCNTGLLVCL